MWKVMGTNIRMAEGDFGIALPALVVGAVLDASDTIRFSFKKAVNGNAILIKDYTPIDNTVGLEFTEEESALFPVGQYAYSADIFNNGVFRCNLVPIGLFKVVEKA